MARRQISKHRREEIVWNGVRFYRYPDSPNRGSRTYFTAAPIRLHRAVWEAANGPVPDGYHIHHIDGDTANNDLSNLECVPASAHLAEHMATPERREQAREHMRRIQPLTKDWHSTPEGKAFHTQQGKRVWAERREREFRCGFCGEVFASRALQGAKFCSPKCRQAQRRKDGVDNEERTCAICGDAFTINKYAKARTCSRSCAGEHQSRTKRGLQPNG